MNSIVTREAIESKIFLIRGQKVMLDSDLAELYGVEVKHLKRQVRRNLDRFPADFMFQLSQEHYDSLREPFWHLKKRRTFEISALRFYGTRRGHAVQRTQQQEGRSSKHSDYASIRQAPGDDRNE
jgi:hypothetical protein